VPAEHASFTVHGLPSSHAAVLGRRLQTPLTLQVSVVQGFPSPQSALTAQIGLRFKHHPLELPASVFSSSTM
jgi:acid phosphatase family membrane protein YuiD